MLRLLALLVLTANPALAQETVLTAAPLECAAAESLLIYGLIDGGIDGDTSDFSALVDGGDGVACRDYLEGAGYGEGLSDPACMAAMGIVAAYGVPSAEGDPGALLRDILQGGDGRDGCVALLEAARPW
ncbi:hypothetical protein [Rubellimicrobium aerolatum]|uniref:Rap1a immunity protein domain-containing protein n=1 Tax=Rubellimicrobium aerolatum TaxID=490979 RepID=A0ABW0SBW1_9RHOB|nr:hypothetical protein [Rubellimicrobium aerolatum]MBP1805940.1 hypothetical protein [Rubellimicrobium aerolatum]